MVGEDMTFKEEIELLLKKEIKVLKAIKMISYEKTDIIMKSDIKNIDNITRQEEKLVNEMSSLEKERIELFNSWGVSKDTSISNVIEKIPEGKDSLTLLKDEMLELVSDIDMRNRLNNDLIRENLDWIDFNMNLITSVHSHPSYGNGKDKKNNINIFDKKV